MAERDLGIARLLDVEGTTVCATYKEWGLEVGGGGWGVGDEGKLHDHIGWSAYVYAGLSLLPQILLSCSLTVIYVNVSRSVCTSSIAVLLYVLAVLQYYCM